MLLVSEKDVFGSLPPQLASLYIAASATYMQQERPSVYIDRGNTCGVDGALASVLSVFQNRFLVED